MPQVKKIMFFNQLAKILIQLSHCIPAKKLTFLKRFLILDLAPFFILVYSDTEKTG